MGRKKCRHNYSASESLNCRMKIWATLLISIGYGMIWGYYILHYYPFRKIAIPSIIYGLFFGSLVTIGYEYPIMALMDADQKEGFIEWVYLKHNKPFT